MARVSRKARFCHWCGTPVLGAQASRTGTDLRCPACSRQRALAGRRLGQANVAVFECGTCGGLWVDREVFEVMVERARTGHLPALGAIGPIPVPPVEPPAGDPRQAYRPCVVCGALMNRRNYGRKSGVIVDVCARHGVWFDLHEIDRLLRWVRAGGEERVHALTAEEAREAERRRERAKGVEPLRMTPEDRRQELADGSLLGKALFYLSGLAGSFTDLFD
jgi:Zn-finger nucleic acid-binding protein